MITGIDHIAIEVKDFEAALRGYQAVFGVVPNWRGRLDGVQHAWFQFSNMALDVIGADGESEAADAVRAEIARFGEGIWGLGFAVPDLEGARRLFERRGLAFVPSHVARSVADDGRVREWRIAVLRRNSAHGLAQFLVESGAERWPAAAPQFGAASVTALDHVVIATTDPERAVAYYGGRLGLDLRLDRTNEEWGARQLFFRCGDAVVEIGASLKAPASGARDRFGGLAWRVRDPDGARARIAAAGLDVSEVRSGRKPGTKVFTVRSGTGGVPTLMLSGTD